MKLGAALGDKLGSKVGSKLGRLDDRLIITVKERSFVYTSDSISPTIISFASSRLHDPPFLVILIVIS
jgi:hypothetical protein